MATKNNYSKSIKFIDGLMDNTGEHKFPLVDARDIYVDDTHRLSNETSGSPGALEMIEADLATTYDASVSYIVGDYCLYDHQLYRCTTAGANHTPATGSSYWTATNVMAEAGSGVGNSIAAAFATNKTYAVGDYVVYQRKLYRCTSAVETAGDWTGTINWIEAILANDIADLKSAINETELKYYTAFNQKGYIESTSKNWTGRTGNTYKCLVIPIDPGDIVRLVGNGSQTSPYGFLTAFDNPQNGDSGNYSVQTGWTDAVTLAKNEDSILVAPSDAHFLYLYAGTTSGANRLPKTVIVNGYDYAISAKVNIGKNSNDIDNVNEYAKAIDSRVTDMDVLSYKSYLHTGYIALENLKWTSIGNDSYHCAVIPVSAGDEIDVLGAISGTCYFAALTAYNSPSNGELAAISSAEGWQAPVTVSTGNTAKYTMPSDAKFLYIYIRMTANGDPQKVFINGYDVMSNFRSQFVRVLEDNEDLHNELYTLISNNSFNLCDINKFAHYEYSQSDGEEGLTSIYYRYTEDLPENATFIGTSESTCRVTLCGWDADGEWVGWYNSETNAFTTSASITTKTFINLAPIKASYPNYSLRFMLSRGHGSTVNYLGTVIIQNSAVPTLPAHIRVMQYNIGKYNYGAASAGSEELYQSKYMNYRKFFGKYNCDVVGMQEYLQYMDSAETHDADEVVFDYLLPYKHKNYTEAVKSRFPLMGMLGGTMRTVETSGYSAPYCICLYNVNNHRVAVLSTALQGTATSEAATGRLELIALLIQLIANEDYALITLDSNINWNHDTEISNIKQLLSDSGWGMLNNDYFGINNTFYTGTDENPIPIDNIFYKANNKIQPENFKVLGNEYENLSSDHYPVIGDFLLT